MPAETVSGGNINAVPCYCKPFSIESIILFSYEKKSMKQNKADI
jgi:hypothetical protein